MIRFGAHAFVRIGDWTAEAGDKAIREAAEAGFEFLEIPLLSPECFDAARHRRELALGAEILCGCLGYALGVLTGAPPTRAECERV